MTELTDAEFSEQAKALSNRIGEVLNGQQHSVVGAALGNLFAIWMTSTEIAPDDMERALQHYGTLVRKLASRRRAEEQAKH